MPHYWQCTKNTMYNFASPLTQGTCTSNYVLSIACPSFFVRFSHRIERRSIPAHVCARTCMNLRYHIFGARNVHKFRVLGFFYNIPEYVSGIWMTYNRVNFRCLDIFVIWKHARSAYICIVTKIRHLENTVMQSFNGWMTTYQNLLKVVLSYRRKQGLYLCCVRSAYTYMHVNELARDSISKT